MMIVMIGAAGKTTSEVGTAAAREGVSTKASPEHQREKNTHTNA